jgi:tyrosyl-tRNA synthetase
MYENDEGVTNTMSEMTLSEELQWRGLIKDRTFEDISWVNTPRTFYLGSDASADSLTIGNLAIYMLARQLMRHGWKAVLLVGGATSLIGDPGGKDNERELKSVDETGRNVAGVRAQVERLFAGQDFELINNYQWFKDIGYLEFLRDVGKHFSMTELIQRDFIASRMGADGGGISYAEFSYSLIQGYDFWWLFKNKDVELQIGGSDQWGNMLSGVPLIRKKEGKEVQALSMPLVIDKATGKKFGKSEEGAVWLDPAKTSPTQFYQFWINVDDDRLADFLGIYTLFSKDEVAELLARHDQSPKERVAQRTLAREVTKLVHGEEQTRIAEELTKVLVGEIVVAELDEQTLGTMRKEVASTRVPANASLLDVLVETGLASSKGEARKLLAGQAIYINNEMATKEQLEPGDFHNGRLLLRKGKVLKNSALVESE